MAYQIKTIATKPDDLSPIPETNMMKGETQLPKKVKFGLRKISKVLAGPFLKPKRT